MNEELQKRIDKANERAEKAALAWLKENDSDIEARVHRILDKRLEEIVAKLMGFDSKWGMWEIDHCNGRSGESAAGDWLREKVGAAVQEWLTKQAGDLPTLSKAKTNALRKEYLDSLLDRIESLIYQKSVEHAESLLESFLPS